jgi:type IV secretory pathway TrbF-like protein
MPHAKEPSELDEFQIAQQNWDERTGEIKKGKKGWQVVALAEFVLLCFAVWGLIHVGSLAKTTVIPVAVNTTTGQTEVLDAAATDSVMTAQVWDQVKKTAFTQLITNWRTVTTDDVLRKRHWDQSFEWMQAQSKAAADLRNWFTSHNPNVRCLQETVSVEVEPGSSLTNNTFEVWWTESVYQGGEVQTHRMQGIFTYRIVGLPTSKHNGFGILITDYSLPRGDYE